MLRRKPVRGLRGDRRIFVLAGLGAVMGTVLDALHVLNKTAVYEHVWTFPILHVAWYVPIEFAVGGITVGMLRPELDEKLGRDRTGVSASQLALGLTLFTVVWFGSGWLTGRGYGNSFIASALTALAIVVWAWLDRTWQGLVSALLTAAIGIAVESALVATTTYRYVSGDILGLPIWLPSLYVIASIAVGNLGRFMKYVWDRETAGVLSELERAA